MGKYAWVTLATNDSYSLGALVLAHSLRRVDTKYELACLVTPGVTAMMREKLAAVFSLVKEVNVLDSKDEANLALLARPELGITFTKLHCWRLTQYEKCVFLDADTLVVRNCDELFEREELSAAPDVGWPDCFNSGVFVFRPSQETFASIIAFAAAKGSFDGGDQGLLNMYFSDWATKDISKHLPFIYNLCSTATYSYLPAFKQFGTDVRIIHFIGMSKPWLQYFDTLTGIVQPPPGCEHLQPLLQLWWNIFCDQVHRQLSGSMGGIAGALAQMVLGEAKSAEQIALEDYMRKQSWELGQMDYMGRDSFDNVWKKICETLSRGPSSTDKPETKEERMDESAASPAAEMTDASVKTDEDETRMQSVVSKVPEEKLSTQEQPPICKLPEEKSPAQIITCEKSDADIQIAQSPEQKTPRVSAEESIKMKTVETKVSSEPVATETGEACAKLADEKPQDAKPGVETSSPKSPEESLLAEALAEKCTLASPPAPEAMSSDQSKSPLEMPSAQLPTKDSQLAESQISTCLLTSVCKLPAQEAAAVASRAAPTDKPQLPASVTLPDVTQPAATPPISTDSQQVTATSAIPASKAPIKDISKCATESAKDVTQPLTIDPSEQHAEMLLAASEISTISPVPIQVAESVLQAEPKESVSGAVASDQAIATTVTAVHESTEITAATTTEPEKSIIQLNGETEKRTTAVSSPPKEAAAVAEPMKETRSDLVMTKEMPSEAPAAVKEKTKSGRSVAPPEMSSEKAEKLVELAEPIAQMDPTAQRQKTEVKSPEQITKTAEAKLPEQPAKTETTEAKAPKQIAKLETEGKSPEQVAKTETTEMIAKPKPTAKAEITETKPTEPTEQVTKAEVAAAKSPETLESLAIERELPAESAEAKAQSIPSTPTVIEATPPTTPSVESAQEAESQEKAKKLKKSDSAEGTDGEDKKKKTVKKVTKKPKSKPEEVPSATTEATSTAAAVDSSQGKAKKTVKVTKKTGAKTLETDTAVPETPPPQPSATTSPPTTPDTPVPPKRKTKSSTTAKGTTGKKPDEE